MYQREITVKICRVFSWSSTSRGLWSCLLLVGGSTGSGSGFIGLKALPRLLRSDGGGNEVDGAFSDFSENDTSEVFFNLM
ncbi:hypothetical protein GE061_013915 [Apolygus lucorum]|uniref:Uncharacterized protein n=1 Tax=Apolygus lucorum TaxID=248454 RepID=A0A8S9XQA3_APOLU|nr:hypothetical protein GE061_013915 [Apolygus lucorum]